MKNKINKILITGGGRRLGSQMAKKLALEDFSVFVQYYKSKKDALHLAKSIRNEGGEINLIRRKMGCVDDCKNLIKEFFYDSTKTKYESFLLINNASSFQFDSSNSFTEKKLNLHMKVNFFIPTFLTKYFYLNLPKHEKGSVINMLDAKLFGLNSDHYSYTLSKYALLGLTKTAALSYAPKLRVNGIAPGITLPNPKQKIEDFDRIREMNPLGNGAFLDEVFSAIKLLLFSQSITGETIIIDGGAHLNPQIRDAAFL